MLNYLFYLINTISNAGTNYFPIADKLSQYRFITAIWSIQDAIKMRTKNADIHVHFVFIL